MATSPFAIPYEKQSDPQTNRGCGAACLSMVYGSFGKPAPQVEIWPAISKKNRFGVVSSMTYLMAQDASKRGFQSVAIQARHPLQVLRLCRAAGVRAILNHRPQNDSAVGHYSVFVDLDDKYVVLHDPFYGPSRKVPHEEMLQLWQPQGPTSEIIGFGLIAIADAKAAGAADCEFCHTAMPAKIDCPRCKQPVGLSPSAPLGCVNNACIARMWNYVSCPSCDYTWTFGMQPGASAAASATSPDAKAPADSKPEPLSLADTFAELDKFCSHVMSLPGADQNNDIKQQIEAMGLHREKLTLSRAEALFHLTVHQERMAALAQTAKANAESHREKMDALNTPAPPLDGEALVQALLKNLGFE